jgi:CMP-N,N'-diacetyllegionaminic acid synthase
MRILAIIPARGGSKGVPRKNIKPLIGKPLIEYTINSALKSKLLTKVILSSDDEEIISFSRKLGVEVPFIRPENLAKDESSTIDVIKHALNHFSDKNENYDSVCLLQPTTPFRPKSLIDSSISEFVKNKTDSLVSVQIVPHQFNPNWIYEKTENNILKRLDSKNSLAKNRQSLKTYYHRDGAIYITKTDTIFKQNSIYGKTISYIRSSKDCKINIDSIEDWEEAENHIKKRLM